MLIVWESVSAGKSILQLVWNATFRKRYLKASVDLQRCQAIATDTPLYRVHVRDDDLEEAYWRMRELICTDEIAWNVVNHVWGPLALFRTCWRSGDDVYFNLTAAFLVSAREHSTNCVVRNVNGRCMIVMTRDALAGQILRFDGGGKGCFDSLMPIGGAALEVELLLSPSGIKCAH